jgi:hypothetical protein
MEVETGTHIATFGESELLNMSRDFIISFLLPYHTLEKVPISVSSFKIHLLPELLHLEISVFP